MTIKHLAHVLAGAVAFLLLLTATTNAQDPRAQLQLLQEMYKEGLITKDVYEQKQREVLGAIIPVPNGPATGAEPGCGNSPRGRCADPRRRPERGMPKRTPPIPMSRAHEEK